MKFIYLVLLSFIHYTYIFAQASENTKVDYNGTARTNSGLNTWVIDHAEIDRTKYIGVSGSDGSNLISMPFNQYFSDQFHTEVYGKSKYFLLKYDSESYVLIVPKNSSLLKNNSWNEFLYVNFLSTNSYKVSQMTDGKIKDWVRNITSDIEK